MRKDSNGGNPDLEFKKKSLLFLQICSNILMDFFFRFYLGAFSNVFNDGHQNGFNTGRFQFGNPLQTVDSQRTDHFVVLNVRNDGAQNLGSFGMSNFA